MRKLTKITKKNSTYEQRATMQLILWGAGNPVHNDIDDECVPDFSCCHGRARMASDHLRDLFIRDPSSRRSMMRMFIDELPDEIRMLYDLPDQHVFRVEH